MNKWWVVIILLIAAVAVNVIFWGFVNDDNGAVSLDQKNGRWVEFVDENFVKFIVASELRKEVGPSGGIYWFEIKDNRLAMFYDKLLLYPNADYNALVAETLVKSKDCEQFTNIENFSLLKNCPYQKERFDFIYFKKGNQVGIVGINAKYFSEEEAAVMINQITVYKK